MKVAYITQYDSLDIHAWSGLGYSVRKALEDEGMEVKACGQLRQDQAWISYAKRIAYPYFLRKKFLRDREPRIVRGYGRQIKEYLARTECDVVLALGTIPLTWVETDRPLVFWTDAVFAGVHEFYPDFCNLCEETIRWSHYYEQTVLDRCDLAIYSSQWAADGAIRYYGADPAKVKVVPFGANVRSDLVEADIVQNLQRKTGDACRLLFAAVDWERKGGDFFLEVAAELDRRGIPVEAHIVGTVPPQRVPKYVTCHGFISKRTPEGARKLEALMQAADFFVLPTRADCAPIVLAEAGSYGVPSLATSVGGIGSQIVSGENGWIYPLDVPASEWADRIEALFTDRAAYGDLALSSFHYYKEELNWATAARRVRGLLEEVCGVVNAPLARL